MRTISREMLQYERELLIWEENAARGLRFPRPVPPRPPAPVAVPLQLPPPIPAGVRIGTDAEGGGVYIDTPDLINGLAVMGLNGTGKSVTLTHIAVHAMETGEGLIVMEPHGSLIENLLARVPPHREQDVELLDAGDPKTAFAINPYYCEDPSDVDLVSERKDEVTEIFKTIWADTWGEYLKVLIPASAYLLLHNAPRYTIVNLPDVFLDPDFREELLKRVPNPPVADFWRKQYRQTQNRFPVEAASSLRRAQQFVMDQRMVRLLGQPIPTVDFGRFMREKKIVLIKLPVDPLGDDKVALLGTIIVRLVMRAAFARSRQATNPEPILFMADEFQRFVSPDYERLINEARKTGVSTVFATQKLSQLRELRTVAFAPRSFIAFELSNEDAPLLVEKFTAPPEEDPEMYAPEPLAKLLRGSHPNPEAVELAVQIERSIVDGAYVRDLTRWQARWVYDRQLADEIRSRYNLYLYRRMTGQPVGRVAAQLRRLGDILATEPTKLPPGEFGGSTPSEVKETVRRTLQNLPTLHALARLMKNKRPHHHRLIVDLPAPATTAPEVIARIRERSRRKHEPQAPPAPSTPRAGVRLPKARVPLEDGREVV